MRIGVRTPSLAEGAADFDAVDAWEHDVEDDEVEVGDAGPGECLFAVAGDVDAVAVLGQTASDEIGDLRLVFD